MNRNCFPIGIFLLLASIQNGLTLASDSDSIPTISLAAIAKATEDEAWVVVDTRASDSFNGWTLEGEQRGGHLPNAVDFSATWLKSTRKDAQEVLTAVLKTKGIGPGKQVVLYSSSEQDRLQVAAYLKKLGFEHLYQFDFNLWANDAQRPLVAYKNFHLIVPPSVVMQLIEGKYPETFERGSTVKFVEASWGDENASYSKGHVPTSFHVNTDHFEPPPAWMLGGPELLSQFAAQYGFRHDDTVIVFGADPTAAYRLAVVLRYMGVRDVRVLNGGFAAWRGANYPIETKSSLPPSSRPFGKIIPGRPELIDDYEKAKAQLSRTDRYTLVDTRTWAEFVGKTSGYKYHSKKGRIPGAVYGQADFKGADSLSPYRNIDNTMRNPDEILQVWKQSGINPKKHLSFMCGSGWRAAEVLTFAQVMGLSETSLYSDGWIGWSNDASNPTESGE